MHEKKIIGLLGVRKYDFCIYLAGVLNNLGLRVLVIDNSTEQEIRYCIPNPDGSISPVTYKNIDYKFGTLPVEEEYEKYDFVLIDMGDSLNPENICLCEELILVTDAYRRNIEKYKEALHSVCCPATVIIRNVCRYKATGRQLYGMLAEESCRVVGRHFVHQDSEDEEYAVMAQYEPYGDFMNISWEFQKALAGTAAGITGKGIGEIMKALKSARKGRCI